MASFHMQHEKFPRVTLLSIEKAQRDFIWGSDSNTRKYHLISWETMCKSKKEVGMNFKNLIRINEAFLLKIGWSVLSNKNSLWNQVLQGKYGRGSSNLSQVKFSALDSRLWKAISSLWPHLIANSRILLGMVQESSFGIRCGWMEMSN